MAGETTTPNIGLQVPAFNQANWQVPTNYNWNLLDLIFGGSVQVPALDVATLIVANIAALLTPFYQNETPSGSIPGTVFTTTYAPRLVFGVYVNGAFQRPVLDYTLVGSTITMNAALAAGDAIYAVYLNS